MADRDPARPGTGALGGQAVLGATAHMNEPPVDGAREADERTIEIEQAPTVYDSHTASANEKEKFSDDSHSDEQARAQRGVDVQGAQDQFDALRRTLSRHSSL